ncbi:hypothetical protein SXCC_04294 [Gluconacetobacter sp. SXCC-1]|nr:hypothetical protein SXCC_04294 [Gluconacetobacter sp. SXCC-1]
MVGAHACFHLPSVYHFSCDARGLPYLYPVAVRFFPLF